METKSEIEKWKKIFFKRICPYFSPQDGTDAFLAASRIAPSKSFLHEPLGLQRRLKKCSSQTAAPPLCRCGRPKSEHDVDAIPETSAANSGVDAALRPTDVCGTFKMKNHGKLFLTDETNFALRLALTDDWRSEDDDGLLANLHRLLAEEVGLPQPDLILSVDDKDTIPQPHRDQLEAVLHHILDECQNLWILGSALQSPTTDLIGKVIEENNLVSQQRNNRVCFLGFAPWGAVWNRSSLQREASYDLTQDVILQREFRKLNPRVSVFLLVDDGTVGLGRHDAAVKLKREFERRNLAADVPVARLDLDATVVEAAEDVSNSAGAIPVFPLPLDVPATRHADRVLAESVRALRSPTSALRSAFLLDTRVDGVQTILARERKSLFLDAILRRKLNFLETLMDGEDIDAFLDGDKLLELHRALDGFDDEASRLRRLLLAPTACSAKSRIFGGVKKESSYHSVRKQLQTFVGPFYKHEFRYEGPDPQNPENCKCYTAEDLYLWSLLVFSLPLMRIFFKRTKYPVHAALLGCLVLKNFLRVNSKGALSNRMKNLKAELEKMACECVVKTFITCDVRTGFLLLQKVSAFGGCTAIQLALESECLDFMSLGACQQLLDNIWFQNVAPTNGIVAMVLADYLPKRLNRLFITFQDFHLHNDFQVVADRRHSSPSWRIIDKKLRFLQRVGINVGLRTLNFDVASPYLNFCNQFIRYVLFSLLCFFIFTHTWFFIEGFPEIVYDLIILVVCVFALNFFCRLFAKELFQILHHGPMEYFSKCWNLLDMFFILFVVSVVLPVVFFQLTDNDLVRLAVIFLFYLCICVKFLQMYEAFPIIGTKTYLLQKMMKDVLVFMAFIVVFSFPYGVCMFQVFDRNDVRHWMGEANETLPNNTAEVSLRVTAKLVFRPYYNLFTYNIITDDELQKLDGFPFMRYIAIPAFQALYVCMANLILMKMLIAMFNFSFREIQEQSKKMWCYRRHDFIFEYPMDSLFTLLRFYCRRACCWERARPHVVDLTAFGVDLKDLDDDEANIHFGSKYEKMLATWSYILSRRVVRKRAEVGLFGEQVQ